MVPIIIGALWLLFHFSIFCPHSTRLLGLPFCIITLQCERETGLETSITISQYHNMHFTTLIEEKLNDSIALFKGVDLTLMVLIQLDHLKIMAPTMPGRQNYKGHHQSTLISVLYP